MTHENYKNYKRDDHVTDTAITFTNSDNTTTNVPHHHSPDFYNLEPKVLSAGVLLYSYAPNSNNVYFLLGREDISPGWRQSDRWSDFGGKKNSTESEIECAAREFVEESLGVVQMDDEITHFEDAKLFNSEEKENSIVKFTSIENMGELLRDKKYTYRIALTLSFKKKKYFSETSNSIDSVDLLKALKKNTPVRSESLLSETTTSPPPTQSPSTGLSRYLKDPPKVRVCYVKRIPWQPNAPERFKVVRSALRKLAFMQENRTSLPEMKNYLESLPLWIRNHPAVLIDYTTDSTSTLISPTPKIIKNIRINKDWLEKSQISWWSLPRLRTVIRNNGKYKKNLFRQGFLPILAVVVEKFTRMNAQAKSPKCKNFIVEVSPQRQKRVVELAISSMLLKSELQPESDIDQ